MGKGGIGPLLELGSEGDLGPGDMAELYAVHTYASSRQGITQIIVSLADIQLLMSSDVLVGSELSAFSPGQCPCIQ